MNIRERIMPSREPVGTGGDIGRYREISGDIEPSRESVQEVPTGGDFLAVGRFT